MQTKRDINNKQHVIRLLLMFFSFNGAKLTVSSCFQSMC